jgi:hypothetical protein
MCSDSFVFTAQHGVVDFATGQIVFADGQREGEGEIGQRDATLWRVAPRLHRALPLQIPWFFASWRQAWRTVEAMHRHALGQKQPVKIGVVRDIEQVWCSDVVCKIVHRKRECTQHLVLTLSQRSIARSDDPIVDCPANAGKFSEGAVKRRFAMLLVDLLAGLLGVFLVEVLGGDARHDFGAHCRDCFDVNEDGGKHTSVNHDCTATSFPTMSRRSAERYAVRLRASIAV